MMGNLALLQDDVGADSEQNDLIEPTMQAVEQAAVLTSRMLAVSRQQPLETLQVNANDLLRGMQSIINRSLVEEIEIAYDLAADLHDCFADPSQLEQAILNLSINARDAMPHGGLLRIATANRLILPGTNEALKVPPGNYVELTVADVGVGIASDNLDRIFDSFFTTKDVGKGTGLGLSMVFGFIKQSEDHITVDSVQGEGTTFCLYLSAAQREEAPVQVVAMEETEGPANNEVILVVEDDGDVLAMVARVLEKNGYRVLRAGNGSDGLALLSAHPEIDMVLSDVLLPGGMNGQQMADAALAEHSDLKILFMSGYSREAIVEQGRLMPGVRLLGKPFNPNVLMQRVRESLGG
jgi:CheY-like chemotaxis protein